MGKMKEWLRQDMKYNPEKYNNPEPTKEEYKNNNIFVCRIDKSVHSFRNKQDKENQEDYKNNKAQNPTSKRKDDIL